MSYFKQIEDYRTYQGEECDFHLDYNANSGGGQAFLGGLPLFRFVSIGLMAACAKLTWERRMRIATLFLLAGPEASR